MPALLIAMTILGCDDSVRQCDYIASPEKRWETVAQCDAESEKRLRSYIDVHYPTIIAVCEPLHVVQTATPQPVPQKQASPAPVQQSPGGIAGFAARAVEQARQMLPSSGSVRHVLVKPVHFAADSYSWVARRLSR